MLKINSTRKEPCYLKYRDEYYDAICEIAQTTVSNGELLHFSNTFLLESTELLKKAVVVFEEGFFDCAFYLLRSSIELLLTLVYLAELSDDERERELNAWKNIKNFPSRKKMLNDLSKSSINFSEIKDSAPEIFDEMNELNKKLNKYAHKQGFDKFYVYRDMYMYDEANRNSLVQDFEKSIESSIKILAIMRLIIDPFPLLLMDDEIMRRTPDFATTCYSKKMIDKYISKDFVVKYKKLTLYQSWYKSLINYEKQNDFVFNVIHNRYINSQHIEDILKQKNLLCLSDLISVLVIKYNSKVTDVYCMCGWVQYFSDRPSERNLRGYDFCQFKQFEENNERINQKFGNAYITRFQFPDGIYLVEHMTKFEAKECINLEERILGELRSDTHFADTVKFSEEWYGRQ